jgi:acetylornithine/N-succinyldiaminopimelate aminotransferase
MVAGTHGSTYGGNPLACAVGNAVVEEIAAPEFLDNVKRKAGLLRQRLAELADANPDIIAEIRGEGLMLGLRLQEGTVNGDFVAAGRENGLLTVPAGANVVRILPPLNIADEDLVEGVARLEATCQAMRTRAQA